MTAAVQTDISTGSDAAATGSLDSSPVPDAPAPNTESDFSDDSGAGAAAPAAATHAPSFPTAAELAQANHAAFAPIFDRLAPKPEPAKTPYDDPGFFNFAGVPEEKLHGEYLRRHSEYARHQAGLEFEKRSQQLEQRFANALAWQESQFRARFAVDPGFSRIESHYNKYVQRGYDPADARRLAQLDAGVTTGAGAVAPGAAAPRPAPLPPAHATTPAAQSRAPAGAKKPFNVYDSAQVRARFNAIADKHGID